jgi:hypothetical protein
MWDRTNQIIHGSYLGQAEYAGVVRSSRVMLGGRVQHTVDLFEPIQVFGSEHHTILIQEADTFVVDEELDLCYT